MTNWEHFLRDELDEQYFEELNQFINQTYSDDNANNNAKPTPKKENIYKALQIINPENVKITILGQDPYPNPDFATGMAFSVPQNAKIPQSLRNIYKESKSCNLTGDLSSWAEQGVMLLNTSLTFNGKENQKIHYKMWQPLTDAVIRIISETQQGTVFLLWGAEAHKKEHLIDNNKHLVIKTVHPSPLSAHRGFIGSNCFNDANDFLKKQNKNTIKW